MIKVGASAIERNAMTTRESLGTIPIPVSTV
jgi:hypothetical protein